MEDLEFAWRFPFTAAGKRVIKELGVSFKDLNERVKERATERVKSAFRSRLYFQEGLEGHREFLEREVLSYPLARVYVSVIGSERLFRGFTKSNEKAAFKILSGERGEELKIRLARELGVSFEPVGSNEYSVSVPDFLLAVPSEPSMKLVNQRIESGMVFLNQERFSRLLSGIAAARILGSLPVSLDGVPLAVKNEALTIGSGFLAKQRAAFEKISGKVRPELFPPCMEKLYAELLGGTNLSHIARFDLATFLKAVGMQEDEIAKAFSNAPNYDEKTTRYQLKKILRGGRSGHGYSAATCAKLRSHGLCVAQCNVSHPVQYYRQGLAESRKKHAAKEA